MDKFFLFGVPVSIAQIPEEASHAEGNSHSTVSGSNVKVVQKILFEHCMYSYFPIRPVLFGSALFLVLHI